MITTKTGGHGRTNPAMKRILQYAAGLAVFVLIAFLILNKSPYSNPLNVDFLMAEKGLPPLSESEVGPCSVRKNCPSGTFSFSILSGAANVVAPKICIDNELVLGNVKNNAGSGINGVVLNGKTGKVIKAEAFNMYNGEITSLIEFLQSLEKGNIVLMATFDEPATKLTDEARNLIMDLGSSAIKSVGFRDNWVFVGGKGDVMKSTFEKHIKNNAETNKYEGWPEILELEGCIPRYQE